MFRLETNIFYSSDFIASNKWKRKEKKRMVCFSCAAETMNSLDRQAK